MIYQIPIAVSLMIQGAAVGHMPPPKAEIIENLIRANAPADTEATQAALDSIDSSFNEVANRALLYAGAPAADPKVMREMRRLYMRALNSVRVLNSQKLGPDYAPARQAVQDFIEYVNRHPPGIIVPPVVSASD